MDEIRRMLGISPEELTDDLETYSVEELRSKEKGRIA